MSFEWRNARRLRVFLWCLLLAAIAVCGLVYADNQDSDMVKIETAAAKEYFDEREKLENEVEEHMTQIELEFAGLDHNPWAAEYYEGDGLGANIRMFVSPVAGVATTWRGCLGLYGANYGSIRQNDQGVLEFTFARKNEKGFGGFADAMRPVRWGERRYLIPEKDLAKFVAEINQGFEPRNEIHGSFALAVGDEKKPADGLPSLPPQFLERIRSVAVIAGVSKIEHLSDRPGRNMCLRMYRVTLDKGGLQGLQLGDLLKLVSPLNKFETLDLTDVKDATASGQITDYAENCMDKKSAPELSWKFSTGAYIASVAETP